MRAKLKRWGELLFCFSRIGLFTFGGGYAMIPLIQRETVERKGWISDGDILDIIAIAEATPGPIAVNAATFVGYKTGGVVGALCATLGVVVPSFLILFGLSFVLRRFQTLEVVRYAFAGIRAGVLALIVRALWSMYRQCPRRPLTYLLAGGAFLAAAVFGVSVLPVIAACGAAGLVSTLIMRRKEGKR